MLFLVMGLASVSAQDHERPRKEGLSSLVPAGKEASKVTTSKLPPEVRQPLAEIGAIVLERSVRSGRINSSSKHIPTGISTLTPAISAVGPKPVSGIHSPASASPRALRTAKRVAEARKVKMSRTAANASPAPLVSAGPTTPIASAFADPRLGEVAAAEQIEPKLAAQVAAVLSKSPPGARRTAAVRMPSEHWLLNTCEGLNELPANERATAFRDILQRYKRMRLEERAASSGGE